MTFTIIISCIAQVKDTSNFSCTMSINHDILNVAVSYIISNEPIGFLTNTARVKQYINMPAKRYFRAIQYLPLITCNIFLIGLILKDKKGHLLIPLGCKVVVFFIRRLFVRFRCLCCGIYLKREWFLLWVICISSKTNLSLLHIVWKQVKI